MSLFRSILLMKRICMRRFFPRSKQWQCGCCLLFLIPVLVVASMDTCSSWPYSIYSSRQYCSAAEHGDRNKNPLLDNSGLPRFEEIRAEHVVPGLKSILSDVENEFEKLETKLSDPDLQLSWSVVSDPLERIGFPLEYSWSVVNHLNGVKNHEELRNAYQEIQPLVVKVATKIAQSRPVYNAMKKLKTSESSLDGPQNRILTSSLLAARHSGVDLDCAQQERFNQILLQLAKLTTDFNNNVLDATKAFHLDLTDPVDVEGLPDSLKQLMAASAAKDQMEHKQLEDFASANGHKGTLQQWDLAFWSERQREHLFSFNDEDLRPYFPLPVVLDGLFNLTSFLFGIQIKPSEKDVQVWCDDVRFFDVLNGNGRHIASFFLDPYTRPAEKRGGAWMDQCLGRSDFLKTKPVAHLVCNQTPPQKDKPSLMTLREVETLFHEFGHGLQHMLTTVPYASAAGIANVEWDAVELPSQFMENWLYDDNTMKKVSQHHHNGDTLPSDLFEKVKRARKFRAGSFMMRQLQFSALDMELHTSSDHWLEVKNRIADEYSLTALPPLKEDRFPCSFMHIFGGGYAAGYYSYKWAEVLAADAFSAFEEAGLSNDENLSKVGRRFRDTILSLGGGTHPTEVFNKFRGRDPKPDALLKLYGLT